MAWYQRTVLKVTCCLVLLVFAQISLAYPTPVDFSGKLMRWDIDINNPSITYEVTSNMPGLLPYLEMMVAESADLWTQVEESYALLTPTSSTTSPMITISFETDLAGNDHSAGYAQFDEITIDGPVHCTVKINLNGPQITNALRKTTLHELGHCLGLGHSLIPEAIMSYDLNKNTFALDVDDSAALARLYPQDGSEPALPLGCSVASTKTFGGQLLYLLLALPVFLALILGLKRQDSA